MHQFPLFPLRKTGVQGNPQGTCGEHQRNGNRTPHCGRHSGKSGYGRTEEVWPAPSLCDLLATRTAAASQRGPQGALNSAEPLPPVLPSVLYLLHFIIRKTEQYRGFYPISNSEDEIAVRNLGLRFLRCSWNSVSGFLVK